MYKALICDVDGTLIPNTQHGMPSQKVIAAINKASSIIPIGIATARSQPTVMHIVKSARFTAPCIITGGAQIFDPITTKIINEVHLRVQDVFDIIQIGKRFDIQFTAADAGYDEEIRVTDAYQPIRPLDIYSQMIPIAKAQEFIAQISHIPTVEAHKALGWEESKKVHVTITHPQASKQHGIVYVADKLGIDPSEIIGIGEGYNDFSFLMACGLKVAMGNAIDAIKKIADYVAPTVADDGVADVIKKFVLK